MYSPRSRETWGISGSYCNIPNAIFYLLKGDYTSQEIVLRHLGCPRTLQRQWQLLVQKTPKFFEVMPSAYETIE